VILINSDMSNNAAIKIEVVVPYQCLLGEGPVWDAKTNVICWIDILKGDIHEYSPDRKKHSTITVNQMVGAIAICKSGGFMGALKNGFGFIDRKTGTVKMIGNPEWHLPANRFNDGKCDPEGRFWAGTMACSNEHEAGSLYIINKQKIIKKKADAITISNGLAWSPDHLVLYHIDTPTSEVTSFQYDRVTGNISNRKIAFKIPKEDGLPDGMTIDNNGKLWIAHWGGWQVSRWDPVTGEKLFSFSLPVSKVTSCTFGGKELTDMYITSAMQELSEDELKEQPLAGSLFVIRNCGFKGIPANEFDA